ncbi:TPA: hypothetical protein RQK66_001715 [Vibrio vulnificus]|nr:hypothetical protein [Vibrio vulnificus]HDY8156491.1 hypothetical protein [Vibrio vulnificus]
MIKPTKSVGSALAEEWIPACAGMTDIESNEISYRPWLLFVVLANAGTHFKANGGGGECQHELKYFGE